MGVARKDALMQAAKRAFGAWAAGLMPQLSRYTVVSVAALATDFGVYLALCSARNQSFARRCRRLRRRHDRSLHLVVAIRVRHSGVIQVRAAPVHRVHAFRSRWTYAHRLHHCDGNGSLGRAADRRQGCRRSSSALRQCLRSGDRSCSQRQRFTRIKLRVAAVVYAKSVSWR